MPLPYGLPIITTNVGVAPDLIDKGTDGFLIDPTGDRTERFATCLTSLLSDGNLRKSFGMKITKKCFQNFEWKGVVRQHANLYESLINHENVRKIP